MRITPWAACWFLATTVMAGNLTARFDLTLDRVLKGGPPVYRPDFVLADTVPLEGRRFTEFSGDVSGRYLEALAVTARLRSRAASFDLDAVSTQVLRHQKPDGHFGVPFSPTELKDSDMAMLWGNGRLLVGLVAIYRLNGQPEVLAAAKKLGDFLVRIEPRMDQDTVQTARSGDQVAVSYICWTQNIEGLVALFNATSDQRFLDAAVWIAARTARFPGQHSHGFLTSLRGILDLYRATHEDRYLQQVRKEWQGIVDSGNWLTQGAIPEIFAPRIERDEGCAEADWLRLSLGLWKETGEVAYLEKAEATLFNEFGLNQFQGGDFGHLTLTQRGISPPAARAWWCCTLHGLRAFPDIFAHVFHTNETTLFYDLPVDGQVVTLGLKVEAESRLEKDGGIALRVLYSIGGDQTIAIRKPFWAKELQARFGTQLLSSEAKDGYLLIRRPWKAGDRLSLKYTLRTQAVPHSGQPELFALFHGPWMLGVDSHTSPSFFDEPSDLNRLDVPVAGPEGALTLPILSSSTTSSRPFLTPFAWFNVSCQPGGYAMQPQMVRLHPVAERTAVGDNTTWAFWFQRQATPTPELPSTAATRKE